MKLETVIDATTSVVSKPILKWIGEFIVGNFVEVRLATFKGTTTVTEFVPITNEEKKPHVITLFGKITTKGGARSHNADYIVRYGYFKADGTPVLEDVKPFKGRPFINFNITDKDIIPIVVNENDEGFGVDFWGHNPEVTPEHEIIIKGTRRAVFPREMIYMNGVKVLFVGLLPILVHLYSKEINSIIGIVGLTAFLWIYFPVKSWIEKSF